MLLGGRYKIYICTCDASWLAATPSPQATTDKVKDHMNPTKCGRLTNEWAEIS